MRDIKFSIILPAHNSEQFIVKTINTVLTQTYNNFELIIVNDGSNDNTLNICNEMSQKDNRIKVINQENGGISSARNKGLEHSQNDWIMFIDHDDLYKKTYLEKAVEIINDNVSVDLIKFSIEYYEVKKNNVKPNNRYTLDKNLIVKPEDLGDIYFKLREKGFRTFVWNTVYRKEFLNKNNITFDERLKFGGEDDLFNIICYCNFRKMILCKEKTYTHYRLYNQSQSTKTDINKAYTSIILDEFESKLIKKIFGNYTSIKTSDYFMSYIYSIFDYSKRYKQFKENIYYIEALTNNYYRKKLFNSREFNKTLYQKIAIYLYLKKKYFLLYIHIWIKKKVVS